MTAIDGVVSESSRGSAVRRGKLLEYATVAYNSLEGVIAVSAGVLAASISLVGFGIDSAIEVLSGLVLIWRLHSDVDVARRETVEKRALRLVGISFLILAAYVLFDSLKSLIAREAPLESPVGIALAAASVIVMPYLARAKRKVAVEIGSRALSADARQTTLCMWLSAIILCGLVLNAVAGWWWADPMAALIMVPIIAREGWEAVRGERCSDHCA